MQDTLHYRHRIECPVKCVDGHLYVRISGETRSCLGVPARPGQCICICICFVCSSLQLYATNAAHIYNEPADYERLAAAVRSMAELEQP